MSGNILITKWFHLVPTTIITKWFHLVPTTIITKWFHLVPTTIISLKIVCQYVRLFVRSFVTIYTDPQF